VKKAFKIAGALLTAILYSIAVYVVVAFMSPPVSPVFESQPSENRILFEVSPFGIPGIPLNQETTVNLFSGAKYSGSDFECKPFTACLKYTEKTIATEFVQYIFQYRNFPIRLRKADFLFPFHYFW
jgi:glycopeptide antibiotics resistance protein